MTDKDEKNYHSERSSRDKFKKERDDYSSRREDHDYYSSRRRRERSHSSGLSDHEERRSKRRRSSSPRGGDHYIPNYSRDGYDPAPRYQDMNSNMNGMMNMPFNGNWGQGSRMLQDPNKLDTLVKFKYFSDYYHQKEKDMDDEELSRRYTIYKENFTHKQSQKFFEAHKKEEWFIDKYHPEESLVYREELIKRKQKMYMEFVEKLKKGEYDNVNFDEVEKTVESVEEANTEKKDENEDANEDTMETEVDNEEKKNISEAEASKSNRLFIKSIPPNVKRKDLINLCSSFEGFDYLAISDPNPQKKFHRLGWIVFKEGTNIKEAFEKFNNAKINDFVFHLAYHQNLPTRSKTVPEIFSTMERLKHDLEQAKNLSLALDREVGLDKLESKGSEVLQEKIEEFNNNEEYDEIKKIKKELDLYIEYLHRVHLFCYYNATEAESTEDYDRKCPVLYRELSKASEIATNTTENSSPEKEGGVENKDKICERIDHKINMRMNRPKSSEDFEKIGGRNVENEIDKFAARYVNKVDEGKYRCKICSKLFKGELFVKKHIKSKHTDLIEPIKLEVDFFNNYAQDIQKITGIFPTSMNQNPLGINMGLNGSMRMMMPQMINQNMPWIVPTMVPPMGLGGVNVMSQMKRNGNYMRGNFYRGTTRGSLNKKSLNSIKKDDKKYPKDPRELRSYVDLDAPVEGDIDINYD